MANTKEFLSRHKNNTCTTQYSGQFKHPTSKSVVRMFLLWPSFLCSRPLKSTFFFGWKSIKIAIFEHFGPNMRTPGLRVTPRLVYRRNLPSRYRKVRRKRLFVPSSVSSKTKFYMCYTKKRLFLISPWSKLFFSCGQFLRPLKNYFLVERRKVKKSWSC